MSSMAIRRTRRRDVISIPEMRLLRAFFGFGRLFWDDSDGDRWFFFGAARSEMEWFNSEFYFRKSVVEVMDS